MLPGKLCIGILEEDNPFKSYFRLRPLLLAGENGFETVNPTEVYPEEGCIRIVPDKNESSHFKTRMRRMGRYCVLDLRAHAGENDKIRPNKNYRADESERNANIVYSDVVREPARGTIYEIADEISEGPWTGQLPATPDVLRGQELDIWRFEQDEGGMGCRAVMSGKRLNEDDIQRFELTDFSGQPLKIAVCRPKLLDEMMAHAAAIPLPEPPQASERTEVPELASRPWISHDMPQPPNPEPQLSPRQRVLAAQCGLNPRRGRSLQEIIEDKWRHSRVDQLGHPVPADAMGCPVENPLERAATAVRDAWQIPELREQLLRVIAETGEMSAALEQTRRDLRDEALRHELEDLEAERLRTLDELDRLRREKKKLRDTFKQEIREEEADDLRACIERTKAARAECARFERDAAEAQQAAAIARDAFDALNDGRFEARLRDFALTSRAAELIAHPPKPRPAAPAYSAGAPDAAAWIERMRRAACAEGWELDAANAANLLILLTLNRHIILSGPAAADKEAAARTVVRALGAMDAGLYRELSGSAHDRAELGDQPPVAVVIRNANCALEADISLGLSSATDGPILISLVADADSGFPIGADALNGAAMIRLTPARADTPWKPSARAAEPFDLPDPAALRAAFSAPADAEPTPAVQQRLQALRMKLAALGSHLSRHALDRMWRYCTAMQPLNVIDEMDALDWSFAQLALPCLLAEARLDCLASLSELLRDMPRSAALLSAPLPIQI